MAPAPGGSGRPGRAALAGFLLATACGSSAVAAGPTPDPEALIERAHALGLAEHASWRALLHYERRLFPPGRRSATNSPELFLDERGASDARAELAATIRGLADPAARSRRDEPVRCSFPARAVWLAERLTPGRDPFPAVDCPALAAWRARIRPQALTVVFPEAFMESPASMFGHTLLRIDEGEEGSELLGWAIDLTADAGGEAGPVYLLKGTLGRYPARFGLNPFWEKLKQYADWQNRDLWEYRLDLDAAEIELVLLHLWELRDLEFPYWFFDENCSYHLVRLLQVARPDIEVRHGFPVSVIPIDTVRDVIEPVGTRGAVDYRPSPATSLRHRIRTLPRADVDRAFALADGSLAPGDREVTHLPLARRAHALDLAYDTLRFRFLDEDVPRDDARQRAHALLLARSQLGEVPALPTPPQPEPRPDRGHGTAFVALASGIEDDRPFVDLRIRPALHDRLDLPGGHSPDATIRVLDTTLRYYPALGRVRLHELTALELRSEPGRDRLQRPWSWHASTGLGTRLVPRGDGDLDAEPVWRSEGGFGASWAFGDVRLHALADLRAETGGSLRRGGAFGPGLSARVIVGAPDESSRLQFGVRAHAFLAGATTTAVEARMDHTLRLHRRLGLVTSVGWNRDLGAQWLDAKMELRFYH